MSGPDELGYGEILDRVGDLAERLLDHDDEAVAAGAEELLDWLDVYHREGLGRLVEMVRRWRGELFLEQAALDPVVGELLATYGLGVDVDAAATERVIQLALDEVRPYVHSHGGELEVRNVVDGVVRLRLHGACDGCTAADDTVARRIEVALRQHWIDFRRVELEEPTAPAHPPPLDGQTVAGLTIGRRPS
ncbi:MAG: NifU family protein [Acidimicrobiia bacterium]|nr:NifU family protein [Acidimicrobiia bacterium]